MNIPLIPGLMYTCSGKRLLLLVLSREMEPQEENRENKNDVAAKMHGESNEIAGAIPVEKDLRSNGVACRPCDEVCSYDDRLLGTAGNVPRDHGHGECLGRPERE